MRIQDNPVSCQGCFRKRTGNPSAGNLPVLESQLLHACMLALPARGCKSVCACVSGWGVEGGRPGPHPSAASLPAASPSRLLWQMFGCAMATPEQDVPGLQQGQAHAHRPPTPFPSPKACCEEEPLGSRWGTNGDCVGVLWQRWHPPWVSGEEGRRG